jgi:hypothetical protein
MPPEYHLDIEQTFESQKDLVVKTIVPNLTKALDLNTYPIGEGVIYEMIHQRHRHQRDNLRNKNKSEDERKREAERKHQNSRRLEVHIIIIFYCNRYLFTSFYKIEKEKKVKDNK